MKSLSFSFPVPAASAPGDLVAGRLVLKSALVLFVVLTASCSNIAEFDILYESRLYRISPDDLSIEAVFPEVENPRSIMIYPGSVFVASASGTVYRFDAETTELLGEYSVGPPSPAGYGRMVLGPRNTAYLISAYGNILELSIPDCQVIDQFNVCPSPVDLEVTSGNPGYLWVADGQSNTVYQVRTTDNMVIDSKEISGASFVHCMEACIMASDSLVIGTAVGGYKLSGSVSGIQSRSMHSPGGSWLSLCDIPHDNRFVLVLHDSQNDRYRAGILSPYAEGAWPPVPVYSQAVTLDGIMHLTAAAHDYNHVYILSYLGDETSRLSAYRYGYPSGIYRSVDFKEYPLDIQTSENGGLYVLFY